MIGRVTAMTAPAPDEIVLAKRFAQALRGEFGSTTAPATPRVGPIDACCKRCADARTDVAPPVLLRGASEPLVAGAPAHWRVALAKRVDERDVSTGIAGEVFLTGPRQSSRGRAARRALPAVLLNAMGGAEPDSYRQVAQAAQSRIVFTTAGLPNGQSERFTVLCRVCRHRSGTLTLKALTARMAAAAAADLHRILI